MFTEMQLGKNGITDNFVQSLRNCFDSYETVRISVLRSAGHEKEKIKELSEELLEKLGKNYTSKIIGFKIIIRKWRKPKRE